MKTKDFTKKVLCIAKRQSRALVVLAVMLAFVMNVEAQQSATDGQQNRMMEFQVMMAIHDTTYKNFIKDGKYKEAIAPLTTLVNILDTTTICQRTEMSPEMIKAAKADYLYDLACCYALTKQKKLALEALGKSVDSGYKRYDNMVNDNDLSSLRKDKQYQALLAAVKDRQPLSVLKKSAPYGRDAMKMENPFSYESKDSKCLSVVREYFKLDSVAGQGDELSKIINLLHFAHDNIRHDGGNRAFAEVRDRLRNDLPLVLCETANWNHENLQTKEYYLDYYIAKNLYYFVCKKYSRFNPESDYRPNPTEEDIRLIPIGFVNENWKCDSTTDPEFFWAKPE